MLWPWPVPRHRTRPARSFYIALKPLPELDGRYAVFGRVTEGLDVVDAIRQGDRITKAFLDRS